MRDLGGANIYLYWQPNQNLPFDENKDALIKICPYLSNIHVFAWEQANRLALSEHQDRWREYINIIKANSGADHDFLLEFVKGDTFEQMIADAGILCGLVHG